MTGLIRINGEKIMKASVFLLSLLMSLTSNTALAEKTELTKSAVSSSIEQLLLNNAKEILHNPTITSVSIGIYQDGKTTIGHYGEMDLGQGNKPTNETLYEMGSVSKPITGALVAKAVLAEKLALEDDIRLYLTGDYPNLAFEGQPIRIKHLLTHTSRLPARIPGIAQLLKNFNDQTAFKADEIYNNYNRIEEIGES